MSNSPLTPLCHQPYLGPQLSPPPHKYPVPFLSRHVLPTTPNGWSSLLLRLPSLVLLAPSWMLASPLLPSSKCHNTLLSVPMTSGAISNTIETHQSGPHSCLQPQTSPGSPDSQVQLSLISPQMPYGHPNPTMPTSSSMVSLPHMTAPASRRSAQNLGPQTPRFPSGTMRLFAPCLHGGSVGAQRC